ncbi:JAB domain-containing protein [Bacteroidetes/Chlorobi group bacterium ChocPot_Mid]|jgi:DNA repair protein RadC|nr:MAG: JAB domain-containing protein [Bacteroidetes/Chlorobi group bacterium ChocPot_Mid]
MPENNHRTIKELSKDDRPRERLQKFGASNLSDSELLAILIRSGSKGYSAIDISRDLIEKYSSLSNLSSCDYSEFKKFKGLAETKAVTLAAAFEIGKRIQSEPYVLLTKIQKPQDIANYFIPKLRNEKVETFRTLLLNSSNKIFREIIVSQGLLNVSLVHPREVFKTAISESAANIILLHNHPSGNPEPSKEDIHITKQLVDAGKIIGIGIYDHIIIAGNDYRSFAEMRLL